MARYNDEIDGLTGKEFNYVDPTNTSSPKVYATNQGLLKDPLDPNHSYQNVTWQISGNSKLASNAPIKNATMGGFVASLAATYPEIANNLTALRQAMDGFDPATIPITYELASNYTILNRYFSSFPGSTMPNRLFLHSATSAGEVTFNGSVKTDMHNFSYCAGQYGWKPLHPWVLAAYHLSEPRR